MLELGKLTPPTNPQLVGAILHRAISKQMRRVNQRLQRTLNL